MNWKTQLQTPALALIAGRFMAFTVTFFTPVILVRLFDQAQFGTYKQIFVVYGTLYVVAQMGMAQSLYYFIPREPESGGRYVVNSMVILAASGLLCLAVFEKTGWKIAQWLNNAELSQYLPVLGLYMFLMLSSAALEIVMISRKRHLLAAISYSLSDFLRAVLLVLPAFMGRRLMWLLWGGVAFAAARLCFMLLYLSREYASRLRPHAELLKKQLAYALPYQAYVLAESMQSNLHHYVVSHSFNAATFAIYSVGCLQIPLVEFVASPVCDVMMVSMSEAMRDGQKGRVLELWHNTTRKLAMLFFPLFGILLLSAHDLIVFLFTGAYAASVPVFMVSAAGLLLAALQTDGFLRVQADTRFLLAQNVIRLAITAAFISWSLSTFGLLGGVLVTNFAAFFGKALALLRIRTLMQCKLREIVPWRNLAAIGAFAAFAGIPTIVLRWQLSLQPLPMMATTGLLYTLLYAFLLFRFGPLSDKERQRIIQWLRRPVAESVLGEAERFQT